jgi:DNA ligase-1
MDLTNFTNSKKKTSKTQVILDNSDVTITKIDDKVSFKIKTKDAMKKYQDFMMFSPTNSITTDSDEKAQEFFEESLAEGVEGLMFKSLSAIYKPGLRAGSMAKLKETKEDIDVVIVAAEHGKGKRAGFYSSFFVAVKNENYNDESDMFLEIGKVSSGIKELSGEGATMENLTNLLNPIKLSEEKGITRFEPKVVIQVRYQEIQKSTTYDSGYALRFPRIINLREDKPLDEVNSIEDVERFIN